MSIRKNMSFLSLCNNVLVDRCKMVDRCPRVGLLPTGTSQGELIDSRQMQIISTGHPLNLSSTMATRMTTETGHRALDFPELFELRSNFNPVLAIPVLFLFKTTTSLRDDVVQRLRDGNGEPWAENVSKRNLGVIPWYRTSTSARGLVPTSSGDALRTTGHCILVDQDLLKENKCIISREFEKADLQQTHECAVIPIADAYPFLCSRPYFDSWFDSGSLDTACRFEPLPLDEPEEAPIDAELPVLIPENCTLEQEEELSQLFQTDWEFEPDFLRVPVSYVDDNSDDVATKQDKNMVKLMQYFLDRGWFPEDLIFLDDIALSSLPVKKKALPTFLYATKSSMQHEAAEGQTIAIDNLGYAVGRLKMEREDDYSMWLGAFVKAIGLGNWVGDRDAFKHYYWICWKDGNGEVDGDITPYFRYD
jgi:hypothetical protein